jgi:hypothetical protein
MNCLNLLKILLLAVVLTTVGCDFNPLGGNKSTLDPTFEPGKHVASLPPTISAIADFTIDENDVQTIPFTIGDPDTFMVCSLVFVKATSSNNTIIDSTGLTVGGTFPNCTLRIAPKALQYGVANITVTVYDFWTYAHSSFNLNVIHILTPGAFAITDTHGVNQAIDVTWQNAAYMLTSGAFTSPYYSIYYRPAYTSGAFSSVTHVTSPYTITGLDNNFEYEIYVLAHNSVGERESNHVIAQPTKFQLRGGAFISGSNQFDQGADDAAVVDSTGANTGVGRNNASLLSNVPEPDSNYPVFNYAAVESPINDPNPVPGAAANSSVITPSGKYKVYMDSQSTILSGVGQ